MAHIHSIHDTDNRFVIDPASRSIIQVSGKKKLMQHDHNSELYTFEIPRYIEGHDMALCDVVKIHWVNAASSGSDKSEGPYEVKDMRVDADDESSLVFTWLLTGETTMYAGSLSFAISFVCTDNDKIVYAWHTDAFRGIEVLSGLHNDGLDSILGGV